MLPVQVSLLCNIASAGLGFGPQLLNGLTHYWKLNEAANTSRADSVGSATLVQSTPPIDAGPGKRNLAAKGPNTAGSYLLRNEGLLFLAPSTISAWVNMASLPATRTTFLNDVNGNFLAFDSAGNAVLFTSSVARITIALGALGNWHLLVATRDSGSTFNMSIDNGIFTSASPPAPTLGSGTRILESSIAIFDGSMDEVGIWNRDLSQDEVNLLWNNGAGRFLT